MTLRVGISWLAPVLFGLIATLLAMVVDLGSPRWIKPRAKKLSLPQDPVPELDASRLSALTGLSRAGKPVSRPAARQPSSLRLRARGTMLGQFVDWAAIEDLETGKMQSYAVGDFVQGARVEEISRSLITLSENGQSTYLEVSGLGRVVATPPPPPHEVSKGRFEVSRREVERILADPGTLVSEARALPSGQGVKIFAVRPGSFIEQLGIQNGDKLAKVNGVQLNNLDAIFSLYSRLATTAHFELELERNGAPVTQTYDVQ